MSPSIAPSGLRYGQLALQLTSKPSCLAQYTTRWMCPTCASRSKQSINRPRDLRRWLASRAKYNASRSLTPELRDIHRMQKPPGAAERAEWTVQQTANRLEQRAIQRLDILLEDSQSILQKEVVPTEEAVLEALKTCWKLANYFGAIKDKPALSTIRPGGEAGNLLFLDADHAAKQPTSSQPLTPTAIGSMASSIAEDAMDRIADTVNKIAQNKNVFITKQVLQQIVEILDSLNRPQGLARIFILYAKKPIPQPDSTPIMYSQPNSNSIKAAIPLEMATKALDAAIRVQNLPLCLDIVEHTVRTKAYKRSKIVRKAWAPGLAVALTPFGAYSIASQFAHMQEQMSVPAMTFVATAGIMTYIGATGVLGFVAMATANDHMQRVTWADGQHLRLRWLREDERAFMDKVACAWGFSDKLRRGEEEGADWEALKELCGMRGMVLDRVNLMEGMQ